MRRVTGLSGAATTGDDVEIHTPRAESDFVGSQGGQKGKVEIHTPRAESDCEILSLSPHLLYI